VTSAFTVRSLGSGTVLAIVSELLLFRASDLRELPHIGRLIRSALIHVVSPGPPRGNLTVVISGPANGRNPMNQIVYIVGLVVIVLVILGFFGLR
jgi:hypothetical protein